MIIFIFVFPVLHAFMALFLFAIPVPKSKRRFKLFKMNTIIYLKIHNPHYFDYIIVTNNTKPPRFMYKDVQTNEKNHL